MFSIELCLVRLVNPETLDLLDIHFRDSPDSLNGLGIPGNIWFRRFVVGLGIFCPEDEQQCCSKLYIIFFLKDYIQIHGKCDANAPER